MDKLIFGLLTVLLVSGCHRLNKDLTSPTPQGLQIPISSLFVDISAFPKDWVVEFSDPKDRQDDSTIGAVFREWVGPGALPVWQNISRAYSPADAEGIYIKLQKSSYAPNATLPPDIPFVEFIPPEGINLSNLKADEFYLACGVWGFSYCEAVARYRNYVTNIHLPLKTADERDGGLTYDEMESVLRGMDQQFMEFFTLIDK
jgi:hypothetical protein